MSRERSRLVGKHGGNPICVAALREAPAARREAALRIIDDLANLRHDVVIFKTGVAASLLFEVAEQEGLQQDLVSAFRHIITVARGPSRRLRCEDSARGIVVHVVPERPKMGPLSRRLMLYLKHRPERCSLRARSESDLH